MGFITRNEAMIVAETVFTRDELAEYTRLQNDIDELEEAVVSQKPSKLCRYEDAAENLNWCRLALKLNRDAIDHFLHRIVDHFDVTSSPGSRPGTLS